MRFIEWTDDNHDYKSTDHEKTPPRNFIYAHAQDFAMSDELQLAILKASVLLANNR
jgi:hypothetical protein